MKKLIVSNKRRMLGEEEIASSVFWMREGDDDDEEMERGRKGKRDGDDVRDEQESWMLLFNSNWKKIPLHQPARLLE